MPIGKISQNYHARQAARASQLFAAIAKGARPVVPSSAQAAKAQATTTQQARQFAVTTAMARLDKAVQDATYRSSTANPVRFEAIEETLPRWVQRDVFEDRPVTIETPIYGTRPTFRTEDVFADRPLFADTPLYELRDIIEQRDITETRDVYETRDVVETRDVFEMRDIIETRPVYERRDIIEQRPVFEQRDIFETRDVFETRPVYETRDVYETRPVYAMQDIRQAVIAGDRNLQPFGTAAAAGIDNGADFSIRIGNGQAAVLRFTGTGQLSVTQNGRTESFTFENRPGGLASGVARGLSSIAGITATVDRGRLDIRGPEGETLSIAEVQNGFFDFSGSPLAALGLRAGTTQTSVTGQRRVQTGTEQVRVGTEQVQTGTETVKTGTEQVRVGSEDVQVGTEDVVVGQEDVQTGTEDVVTGQERVKTGTEEVITGQEDVLVGTEDVVVGREDVVVGQERVQVGTSREQVGVERVLAGTRQVLSGEERYITGVDVQHSTAKVLTGTRTEKDGATTTLLGFRRVESHGASDPGLTLQSQRAIREGVLLLQQAIGPEKLSGGVVNPYAGIGKSLDLDTLRNADTRRDLGSSSVQIALLLKQLRQKQQVGPSSPGRIA